VDEPVLKYVLACRNDLGDARMLLEMGRQFNVPRLAHSALIHLFRGVFLHTQNRYPPLTVDLTDLARQSGADTLLDREAMDLLQELTEAGQAVLNPVYHQKMAEEYDLVKCRRMLRKAREIQARLVHWIGGEPN